MLLENSFEVAVPPDAAWELLTDVPAVLPCMPGAELLEVVDDDRWTARLQVRLGPISLQFLTELTRDATDVAARRAVLGVEAREAKGRGTARATITSSVEEATGGSRVSIVTDLTLRGPLTQHARVVVAPVAERLTEQFAACISQKLVPAVGARTDEAAKPVGAVRRFLGALWHSLTRRRGRAGS
jgi:carbon monoxide dehydrogenase subunit G